MSVSSFLLYSSSCTVKSHLQSIIHSLLERCSTLKHILELHSRIVTNGLLNQYLIAGKLIAVYATFSAAHVGHARKLFDDIPIPNRFMWNSMIRGYVNADAMQDALALYRRMVGVGQLPNQFTLPFVLKACAIECELQKGLVVHGQIVKLGFCGQVFVQNALLHVYSLCGWIASACKVFDSTLAKSLVSWNSMLGAYCRSGFCEEACAFFHAMRRCGVRPDNFTFVNLLSLCSHSKDYDFGRSIHQNIEISGVEIDLIVKNALLDMYSKNGDLIAMQLLFDRMADRNVVSWTCMISAYSKHGFLDLAYHHFEQMPERNVISWNCMLSCYLQHGLCREALNIYAWMLNVGEVPDETTLVCALSACTHIGDLVIGKHIHSYITNCNLIPTIPLCNSLIDMYGKCGVMQYAVDLFNWMPMKNVVSWNVIIGALAIHGYAKEVIHYLARMTAAGFVPDGITFVGILSACSHGGLLDHGRYFFGSMNRVFDVPYEIEHFACMIDLLGRVGNLKEAVALIDLMPMEPDAIIWGSLLGACRVHLNIDVGMQVLRQLLDLGPCPVGLYVLVANMFCEANRWEDAKKIRKMMNEQGIIKEIALSSIEVFGIVHEFLVEDKRHEFSSDIYHMLEALTNHMRSVVDAENPFPVSFRGC